MAITNGFDETRVLAALGGRLGWLQPTETGYDVVNTDNQASTSGRYFNDGSFHAALKVQNIYDCQEDKDITSTEFNALLVSLRRSNLISALTMVFEKPQFIESGLLYERWEHTAQATAGNNGKFVGVRIKLAPGDRTVQLTNVLLQFDSAATFNLYLYNSLKKEPVYTKEVTTVADDLTTVSLGYTLNYDDAKGGVFFLGYYQSDLGEAKALRYTSKWNCYSFGAVSFEASVTGDDFDRYSYSTTYDTFGINLETAVYRDLTPVIVGNAHLFDELQGLMMAAKVIELVLNSTRTNENQRISKDSLGLLYRELNTVTTAENPVTPGLKSRISKEVKRVQNAFQPKPKTTIVRA